MSSQVNYASSTTSSSGRYIPPNKRSKAPAQGLEGVVQDMSQLSMTKSPSPVSPVSKDVFQPRGKTGLLWVKPDVSEAHVKGVDGILKAFPEGLRKHFRKNGCQIMLTRTMDEVFPEFKGTDTSLISGVQKAWCELKGLCRGKVVSIPEYFLYPKTKEWVAQVNTQGGVKVSRHETMHLLHNTSSLLWDFEENEVNDEFYEAYMKDVRKLSSEQLQKYSYAIQTTDIEKPSMHGMKELFAKLAAVLHGGGCLGDSEGLKKAFPRVTEYLMQGIKSVTKSALKG